MNVLDTLTSVAKGAAAGSVAGPIGAAVGGLGGLVVDIAPEVGRWLFGGNGEATAALVAQAVQSVTGTNDADAAQTKLAEDPAAVSQLRVQLAMIAAQQQQEADRAAEGRRAADLAQVQAAAADRSGARSQTQALAQMHSGIAWAPAALSAIILVAFGGLIFVVLTKNNLSGESMPLANVLLGSLAAMATQVANYWLGSSSGSAAKSDQITALTADAQGLVPSEIVHRLLSPGMIARAPG
jgi:FlaG/FlaF family flagellin (archaellin)